ncbi:flagellar assembly protein A [Paenibacillus chartarius]|uniref:Flagellar assembly protein A n=1 Tax=Paenibacillus chartarius TaxID=747481 RepID=A0ABV6DLS8_9BACL
MGKSFVSKGKNIQEAVDVALQYLHTHQDEVDIVILENETRGLLGIGAKPAVVRVTIKDCELAESQPDLLTDPSVLLDLLNKLEQGMELSGSLAESADSEQTAEDAELHGKVWVRDGHIFCKEAPDVYPLVTPAVGMKLYINDELIEKTTVVSENFLIVVDIDEEVKEPEWELLLSEDKMSVKLKIIPGYRKRRRLKDMDPSSHIQLEIEEKTIPAIIETDPIMDKLKELGVVYGIDYVELAAACTSEHPGTFVIAEGSQPRRGKNGWFAPLNSTEIKKGLKERENGSVDYREIQEFPTVVPGQVIGSIEPPVEGVHGTTVTNELVPPPEVYPLHVREGKGISLVDEGKKIIATDAGHPEIVIKGQLAKISIIPKIVINKDVSLETGNVRYAGAVEIHGSVQDGMLVEAKGDVSIRTNMNRAKVTAGNSIIVHKNIISSQVSAGNRNIMNAEMAKLLGEIITQVKFMLGAIDQLSKVSAFKVASFSRTGLGPLIKILCDGKFKTFPPLVGTFIHKINSSAEWLDEEWIKLAEQMKRGFLMIHSAEFKSLEDLRNFIGSAEEVLVSSAGPANDVPCFIKGALVHNSLVYSSGDIHISGQGVYNSKLYAGGTVRIDGYVRGGDIYGEAGVVIGEAGARGGSETKISVGADGTIRIRHVLEDTLIQVGPRMHKFLVGASNVYARLNDKGDLQLH